MTTAGSERESERERETVHLKETVEAEGRECCFLRVHLFGTSHTHTQYHTCTVCAYSICVCTDTPTPTPPHTQDSPGDCGLGETTANLLGDDFGGNTASTSFCISLLEAVAKENKAFYVL